MLSYQERCEQKVGGWCGMVSRSEETYMWCHWCVGVKGNEWQGLASEC